MKKKQILFLCALIITLALSGCSGGKSTQEGSDTTSDSLSSDEPVYGGSIAVGIPQDLEDSLDPHKAVAAGTREILFNIFEGLVKPDEDGNYIDAVAAEHQISDDGKTYTFTLRDGVKFHDGTEVTADDVVYSIERCADTSGGEPLVSAFSIIEKVTATDENTVEIQLTEPNTEFLAYLSVAIIPKDYTQQDTAPIGTGPYKFVSRTPGENIILEKNEEYWGEEPYLDEVTFKVLTDANAITTSLQSGSIDMAYHLNSTQILQLGDTFTIYEGSMNLVQALYLNNTSGPLADVRVRQAMAYAADRQEVMDMISDGKGAALGSSIFPSFTKYFSEELVDAYPQNIEKAKELLTEAGYPDGFDLVITVPSNYQPHIDTAQVLVEQLKQININATINLIEWESWLTDVYVNREYEATVIGVDATALTARALLERFVSDNSGNFINYSNEEYDALFAEVIKTTDEARQIELYKQMEALLSEDAANVYLQDMADFVGMNSEYAGYTFYPLAVQDISKIYSTTAAE
ncbi:MAG: ABC transporter substrate-binding protein [Lachnospiraceae bacterium]